MDFKSAYYDAYKETLEKYGITEEAAPYAGEEMQNLEEMWFAFTNFLIS